MNGGRPAAEVPRAITAQDARKILAQFKAGLWGGAKPGGGESGQAG
jgi:hypothetical protein